MSLSVGWSFLSVYVILQLLLRKRLRISKTTKQVCASIIKVKLNQFPDLFTVKGLTNRLKFLSVTLGSY